MDLSTEVDRYARTGQPEGSAAKAGPSRRRLLGLALLAGALTISFYTLLLMVVLAVLAGFVLLVSVGRGWGMVLALPLGLLVAATRRSLVAAIPRRARREPPGIEVARSAQPRLWAVVDALAADAGQPAPDSLRIVFGGSAGVMEHGAGIGKSPQRVLIVPFSYLIGLSRAQLGAVVAHELAHFAAADTTVMRWISSVGEAIGRTVAQLERRGSVLRYPFRWYAHGFFALTAAFLRRRELAADALSARLCGGDVAAAALQRSASLVVAFDAYWAADVSPLLNAGVRPPLGAGFRRFLEAPGCECESASPAEDRGSRRFASHPPTAQRLALLGSPSGPHAGDGPPASDLLRDADSLEAALLIDLAGEQGRSLTALDWEAGAARVRAESETNSAVSEADSVEEQASAPAAGPARWRADPLDLTLEDRELDGVLARVAFWLALGLGLPLTGVLLFVPLAATTSLGAQAIVRAIGVVMGCAVGWLIWTRRRARAHPPRLTVNANGFTLVHPRLLREPLCIPREVVRVAAVNTGAGSPDPRRRFPVYPDRAFDSHAARAAAPRGWVWPSSRAQLPLYSLARETPNLLILLDRQVPGPHVRRETLHGPLTGELLYGLLTRAKDADSAAHALGAAGLVRPLTVADLTAPATDTD